MDYENKNKDAISTIKQALRQLATNGVPVGNMIKAINDIEEKYAESEDERIRNFLIKQANSVLDSITDDDEEVPAWKSALAWLEKQGKNNMGISEATKQELEDNLNKALEKETPESWNKFLDEQGEQKPTDKFHEGDWVVISTSDGEKVVQIDSIEYFKNGKPRYITSEGRWFGNGTKARLWTIQDAKDGDVLCYKDEILLYKHDIKNCTKQETIFGGFVYHCCYDGEKFIVNSLYSLTEQDKIDIHPATKEQHNQLEKAMADAGYEWDAKNKQLRKVEPRQEELTEFEKAVKQVMEEAIECGDTHNLKADADMLLRLVQKSSWSKEDERIYKSITYSLAHNYPLTVQQQEFVKSLKERYTWRPSYEQVSVLEFVMGDIEKDSIRYRILKSVLEELKKLREK